MRKCIYLFLLFISLFYASCKQKTQTDTALIIFNHDRIKDIEKIEFDNRAFIDSCEFVRLETSDESLFGEITQLETIDRKFYIYDKQTKKVKAFDCTGNFLYDIGKLGQGPGEYVHISFFFLNPKKKKIGIYDPGKSAIHEYTLDGTFLQSINLPRGQNLSVINKAVCIDNYIYCFSSINAGNNSNYIILSSKDYSIIKNLRPYPVKPQNPMYAKVMNHPYSIIDGKFHYVSLFSDTIYTYENEKEAPYLFIETGKPNISSTYLKNKGLALVDNPVQSCAEVWRDDRYSPGFTELGETNRFILAKFNFNSSFYLLDKNNNEGFLVKSSFLPDLGTPLAMDSNKIIRVWTPSNISAYQEEMKNEKNAYPKQIESLMKNYDTDYENPILVVYYMKDK